VFQFLTDPSKARYLRYASFLVTAAYHQYASFLEIRKPRSRAFYGSVSIETFYEFVSPLCGFEYLLVKTAPGDSAPPEAVGGKF
jgi:hypothetical protein